MPEAERVRTNCRFCGYLCGLTATVEQGRVIAVEPDATRYPYDASIQKGCPRWKTTVEFLDHPARVNYPLKRVGERGSGQWQRVTWEEALDDIASRLGSLKDQYGPETLATSIGGPHAVYWPLHRFMNLFGSPNNMGIGQICWNPGIWINTITYGWPVENELNLETTAAAIIWGTNPADSDNSLFWKTIRQFKREGKPLIVVDPRRTRTAAQATLWLPVRPGMDAFLALGLLQVIISEDLYDHEFVNSWCQGFEKLAEHVASYTPEFTARVTGVKVEMIREAARLYSRNGPAAILSGRGLDQSGVNTPRTHQALAILRAITGNLDVPGASHMCEMPDVTPEIDLELSSELPEAQRLKQLNRQYLRLQSYQGYEQVDGITRQSGKRLPMRYLTSAHPNLIWRAMLTGEPYPIRALIVMGNNPLLTQADTHLIYRALKSLDLLVALEYFKTPTAMLADYILPSAGILERPLFQTNAGIANIAYGGGRAVAPYYERRADYLFWRELGIRFGQVERWPWETFEESLDAVLSPAGLTWEQFCEEGLYYQPSPYRKHEETDPVTGLKRGFPTSSRKVELFSEVLSGLGYDPLPVPSPPPPSPDDFPLLLMTGMRTLPFYASSYHQIDSLRSMHPQPLAEMSAATGAKLGLEDGAGIRVETDRGQASFTLKVIPMCDNVVSVEYGWWFPGMAASEPELGGLWISNANVLTNGDIETSDPLIGSWTYNGIPCRVIPVNEMEIMNEP